MSSGAVVEVLLATYNGERFLREQIDSILAQDYADLRVLARDDGSSDGTVEVLNEYASRFPDRFRIMPKSAPTGSAKDNFLLLMKASTADYICFSDQDDIWLPHKVSITKQAMDELEAQTGTHVPLLVFTDLHVVDDKLKIIHQSFWKYMGIDAERINKLAELLGKSVVTGCTAMLNRRLLEIALHMPSDVTLHDRWIALLASVLGRSSIVREQTVLYRQHDRNVVGTGRNETRGRNEELDRSVLARLRRFRHYEREYVAEWESSQRQAAALLRVHGVELREQTRVLLGAYLRCGTSRSRFIRVATLIRYGFYFAGLPRNLATIIHLWKKDDSRRTGDGFR